MSIEAVPGVFFLRQEEEGGRFLFEGGGGSHGSPLFLADRHLMPELGVLGVLSEEEKELLMLGATLFLGGGGYVVIEHIFLKDG